MYAGISDGINNLIAQMVKSGKLTYAVGDRGPAGGIIFYDKGSYSDGWRYLEAAPKEAEFISDWGSNNDIDLASANKYFESALSREIGTGKQNTQVIISKLSDASAAKKCAELNYQGYDDWFLPSAFEGNEINKILAIKEIGDFSKSVYLTSSWSSIEYLDDKILAPRPWGCIFFSDVKLRGSFFG